MKNLKMKPSFVILEVAREKAAQLSHRQQMRVGGGQYAESYWVFNINDCQYIGWEANGTLQRFFKNRPTHELVNNETGAPMYYLQILKK
jgi:hypothetical protein